MREEAIMSKHDPHDESRRAFLVGAGALAGAAGLASDAGAQAPERDPAGDKARGHSHAAGEQHGAFFNDDDAAAVAALAELLMPGAPGLPGARDAGVLNYIDLALAGPYAAQQDLYRRGLAQLDAHCRATYNNTPFVRLD